MVDFRWWFNPMDMRYKIACVDSSSSRGCVINSEEFFRRKEEQPNGSMDAFARRMLYSTTMTECWQHVCRTIGRIEWGTFEKIVSEKLNAEREINVDASRWKEIMQSYCKEIEHA